MTTQTMIAIDAGNTRIKWRVVEASTPLAARDEGAFVHDALDALPNALADVRARHPGLQRAFGCNVAGATVAARIAEACAGLSLEWLTSTAACAGAGSHCGARRRSRIRVPSSRRSSPAQARMMAS